MGLFDRFKIGKTVIVMDGVSLNDAAGMKGSVAPRNQLQLLRRLSRFSEREKVELVVVLAGSPLHKAPAGKKFDEVMVLYSKTPEVHAKNVVKVAGSKGGGAILVSSNVGIEKMALGAGTKTMRLSTFRKAFDIGGNGAEGGGDRQDRGGGERGGNRNGNRSPRRRQPRKGGGEQPQQRKQERPPKKATSSEADAINELIDLID